MLDLSLPQLSQRVATLEQKVASPLNWRGAYDAKLIYKPNDVVTSGGSTYVCIKAGFNQTPASSPTYWLLVPGTASGSFVNPMTTTGDIIVGSPGSTPARIPKGASPSLFGVDGVGNMGYRQLVAGDLPTRLVGDVIFDWSSTNPPTDYWTGGTAPANTWTTLGAWAFTPRRTNSLIGIDISGYMMLYAVGAIPAGSAIAWTTGLRLDTAGNYVAWLGGGEHSLVNENGNVIDNASTVWLNSLSATTHTIFLDMYPSVTVPVYWRSASTPWERIHVEIVEFL